MRHAGVYSFRHNQPTLQVYVQRDEAFVSILSRLQYALPHSQDLTEHFHDQGLRRVPIDRSTATDENQSIQVVSS